MRFPRILYRYLLRDFAFTWVVLFLGLTVITMVGQLPQILGRAADHEIAPQLILEVLMFMLVANAPVLMLLTMLLAFVVTLGRLGSDSEITAMRAAGFSPLSVLGAGTLFAAPVIALLAVVCLSLGPRAYCSAVLARTSAIRNLLTAPIKPGTFMPLGERGTLLAASVAPDGEMRGVFAAAENDGTSGVITAARGRIRSDLANDRFLLALYDGRYYEGIPGERKFRVIKFQEYTRPILFPPETSTCSKPGTRTTSELLAMKMTKDVLAELNQRFGYLALAPLFLLLAIPLSLTRPRTGAYSRVPLALGVFALATFGVSGISGWSARSPGTATAVQWSLLGIALLISLRWLWRLSTRVSSR
jgi:lipopolysaccharide export system permease protein